VINMVEQPNSVTSCLYTEPSGGGYKRFYLKAANGNYVTVRQDGTCGMQLLGSIFHEEKCGNYVVLRTGNDRCLSVKKGLGGKYALVTADRVSCSSSEKFECYKVDN
jgi:hypothetical protein